MMYWFLRWLTFGVFLVILSLFLVVIFLLPKNAPAWIPFWVAVIAGLIVVWSIARQYAVAPQFPRRRIAARCAAWVEGLFGGWLLFSNEVQARRNGDWEGYLTFLSVVLVVHAVTLMIALRRSAAK